MPRASDPTPRKGGLRELKKQRTRQTILDEALKLFVEQGYRETTLEQIANASEISTGTLFAYFPNKEEILFPDERRFAEELERELGERTSQVTTIEVLRRVMRTLDQPTPDVQLRWKIMIDEGLAGRHLARSDRVDRMVVQGLAEDLQTSVEDLRVIILARSIKTVMVTLGEHFLAPDDVTQIANPDYSSAVTVLERMFDALAVALREMRQLPGTQ